MNIYPQSAAHPHRSDSAPRYALTRGLGAWQLTFEGQHAILKHEQGLFYVACVMPAHHHGVGTWDI